MKYQFPTELYGLLESAIKFLLKSERFNQSVMARQSIHLYLCSFRLIYIYLLTQHSSPKLLWPNTIIFGTDRTEPHFFSSIIFLIITLLSLLLFLTALLLLLIACKILCMCCLVLFCVFSIRFYCFNVVCYKCVNHLIEKKTKTTIHTNQKQKEPQS